MEFCSSCGSGSAIRSIVPAVVPATWLRLPGSAYAIRHKRSFFTYLGPNFTELYLFRDHIVKPRHVHTDQAPGKDFYTTLVALVAPALQSSNSAIKASTVSSHHCHSCCCLRIGLWLKSDFDRCNSGYAVFITTSLPPLTVAIHVHKTLCFGA
jgi:hypothetical protein